jgi:ubiquinone/menaquinone biosynthesis C-methylase UbiE
VGLFVPARRRGLEILDDQSVDPATRLRSIEDVARSNRLFGGRRAAVTEISTAADAASGPLVLLDVGTGLADIVAELRRHRADSSRFMIIGVDAAADLLREAATTLTCAVCGSAVKLPFRDRSVDIVLCSQLLHHFADDDLATIVVELNRVARRRVIIADLRRSWFAAAGFWLASFPLRFHAVTRHDGVLSVLRGFTADELRCVVGSAVGATPTVQRRLGYRLTVSWEPT